MKVFWPTAFVAACTLAGCAKKVPPAEWGAAGMSDDESSSGVGTTDADGSGGIDDGPGDPQTSDESDGGTAPVPDTCGDGVVQDPENCDGDDLGGSDCTDFGFDGGELACSDACQIETDDCIGCGNGQIDDGEVCDGSDLGGETCVGQGFGGGSLTCSDDCADFDTSSCEPGPECGDGERNGVEQCDGDDLAGATCASEGFTEGTITCADDCAFDTSECIFICVEVGEPCNGPTDCCNTGCGGGGAFCTSNGVNVCCT